MHLFLNNLRGGIRQILRQPGFALLSIGVLAIGIGLVTAQFSFVNGVVYKGLPFPEGDRLIHVERNHFQTGDDGINAEVPIHDLEYYRAHQTTLNDVAGHTQGTINVSDGQNPQRYRGGFLTANCFSVLGVSPILGRDFIEGEDQPGAPAVLILGYRVWQEDFGGDPDVLGRAVRINGLPGEIVGVMPEGFAFPISEQVWMPHRIYASELEFGDGITFEVFGKMRPGVTRDAVAAEFSTLMRQFAEAHPETHEGLTLADVKPYVREYLGTEVVLIMHIMLLIGFLVLVISCANVANLTLARSSTRTREMSIRAAVGASRSQLTGQMLTETFVLAGAGSLLGLFAAWWSMRVLGNYIDSTHPPFWIDVTLDGKVLAFSALVMLLTALLSGLIPARQASRINLNEVMKDGSRGTSLHMGWFSKLLVGVQIAVSCAVLLVTLAMVRGIWGQTHVELPFETEQVFTTRMGLFEGDYPTDSDRTRFFTEIQQRAERHPQIEAAALGSRYRFGQSDAVRFVRDGEPLPEETREREVTRYEPISPGYFQTLGVDLLDGRDFALTDTAEANPVVIVNSVFAERFFAGENPLGQRILVLDGRGEGPEEGSWRTIIGVAPNLEMDLRSNWDRDLGQGVYVPLAQNPSNFATLLARSSGDAAVLGPVLRSVVLEADPNLPLYHLETIAQSLEETGKVEVLFFWIFASFGLAATFLAGVGIYGVVSFGVQQRIPEVGIRMAVGATPRRILGWVFLLNRRPWIGGVLIGGMLGSILQMAIGGDMFGGDTSLHSPDYVLVLGFVCLVVAFSTLLPARRAAAIPPMRALRDQ
jgi:predicted permease